MNLSYLRITSTSESKFPTMGKSSQNRPEKSPESIPVPAHYISVRLYGVNITPVFFLLLLVCGVAFSVLTITNGSVSLKFIEITPLLQSAMQKHSWEDEDGEHLNHSDADYRPLLTLFTSFKNRKDKWRTYWNVIQNWSLFQPKVRVVLFNDSADRSLLQFAHDLNWTVLSTLLGNHYGTPLLREMFLTCQRYIPNSVFYGYANGDILFDRSLLETIEVVSSYQEQMEESLVVGRRTNFKVRGRRITTLEEVSKIANTERKQFHADTEDYFFLAHNKFPWLTMPDIVTGRPRYANYLVATAQKHDITIIDATQTLVALHQRGYYRNYDSHKYTDSQHKKRAMGSFDDSKGLTSSSQYVTQYAKTGRIELCRRPSVQGPATLITLKMPSAQTPATLRNITKYKGNMYSSNIKSLQDSLPPISRHGSQEPLVDLAASRDFEEDIEQRIIDEVLEDEPILDNPEHRLLTLFTVFTPDLAHNTFHLNILQNWAWYHPNVTTVLFSDSSPTVIDTMSKQLNWTVLPTIPQTGVSLPLKKMFLQAQHVYPRSTFYGYIKGDLLFGEGLIKTLQEVAAVLDDDLDSALIVGAKYPYLLKAGQEIYEPDKVDGVTGSLSQSNINENFMLAHYLFPWQHIPDLVIGHSVYDNYLVALALRYDFAVVDATHTLTALEQISQNTSLVQTKPENFDPNLLAALDYAEGYVTSAQYETTYDASGKVKLLRRQSEGREAILLSQP